MLLLAGLHEQHISIFFFFLQRFNSTKNPSKSFGKEVVSNLAGISSRMYKRIPPPLPFLSNLIGAAYSQIWHVDKLEYAEINGDVHLFRFRPEIPFLGKFRPK